MSELLARQFSELLVPAPDVELAGEVSEEVLGDQLRRWARLEDWQHASRFARELATRDPSDPERLREAAQYSAMAGEDEVCVQLWTRLAKVASLTHDDIRNKIAALVRLGALTQAAHEVAEARLESSGSWEAADFAARAWWELKTRVSPKGSNDRDVEHREWCERALRATIAMVDLVTDEHTGVALLERLWEWRFAADCELSEDLVAEIVAQTKRVAEASPLPGVPAGTHWPRCRSYAALMLGQDHPNWSLRSTESHTPSVEMTEARINCHFVLQDFQAAMAELDHLVSIWGSPRQLVPDSLLRFQWARTLLEVGRLQEAEDECREVLAELEQLEQLAVAETEGDDAGETEDAQVAAKHGKWARVRLFRCFYIIDLARIASLTGRYTDAWTGLREAVALDHDELDSSTRLLLQHVAVVTAGDVRSAAAALGAVGRLTDPRSSMEGGQLDTTYIEASLRTAGRWESAEGTWECLTGSRLTPEEAQEMRQARARGLAMARAQLSRSQDGEGLAQRLRLALFAGDELQAEVLARALPRDLTRRWDGRVLRAVTALQGGRDREALKLMRLVMAERRFDIDLRVLYAHSALLAGEVDEAAQECLEIVEMVPENVLARVVRAECSFELALRRGPRDDGSRSQEIEANEAAAMENVQQLIVAVAEYHQAVVLDTRTKRFLASGAITTPERLGSDVLTPRQVMQVCRRGLHAAVIAQEGVDRLGLTRDRTMERQACELVRCMRSNHPAQPCKPCEADRRGWALDWVHRARRHLGDRDEPARLAHLMTGYRRARRLRILQSAASVTLGLVLAASVLFDVAQVNERVPGLGIAAVRATTLAFGFLLVMVPFVHSIKVGNFELHRPDRAPPILGRSKALRASSVLQRNALLTTTTSLLPSMPAQLERKGASTDEPAPEVSDEGLGDGVSQPRPASAAEAAAGAVVAPGRRDQVGI